MIRFTLHFFKWCIITITPYTLLLLGIKPNVPIWELCVAVACVGLISAHIAALEMKTK